MDRTVAIYCNELFSLDIPINEMIEFLALPHEAGGLQMSLPGKFFNIYQAVLENKGGIEEGFKSYHQQKNSYIKDEINKAKAKAQLLESKDVDISHYALLHRSVADN